MTALIFIVILILSSAASWAVTIGILYAICYLLGWTFSLAVATAIWLALILVKSIFNTYRKD